VVAQAMVRDLARVRLGEQPGRGKARHVAGGPGVDQGGAAADRLLAGDAGRLCDQALVRWGESVADGLLALSQTKLILRGIADWKTLGAVSLVAAEYNRQMASVTQRRTEGHDFFAPGTLQRIGDPQHPALPHPVARWDSATATRTRVCWHSKSAAPSVHATDRFPIAISAETRARSFRLPVTAWNALLAPTALDGSLTLAGRPSRSTLASHRRGGWVQVGPS